VPEKGYNFLGKTDSLSLVLSVQTCPFFILSKREMRTTGCPANTESHILSKDYSLIEGTPFMRRRWKRAGRVSNEYGIYRWRPCPVYKGWSDHRRKNGSHRGRWLDGMQSSTPTQMERLLSILLFYLEFYCVFLVHPLLGNFAILEEVA